MFAKADVNGPDALPLFNYLKSQQVGVCQRFWGEAATGVGRGRRGSAVGPSCPLAYLRGPSPQCWSFWCCHQCLHAVGEGWLGRAG